MIKPHNKDKFEYNSVTIIGFICNIDKYFLEWLYTMCEDLEISVTEDCCIWEAFQEVCKKKNLNLGLFYFSGGESIILDEEECIVGVFLESMDERFSLKRMKIDVYNALVDINFIFPEDTSLEMISVFSDVICYDKETENDKKCKE